MGFFGKTDETDILEKKKNKSIELANESQAVIGFVQDSINNIEDTNKEILDEVNDISNIIDGLGYVRKSLMNTYQDNEQIVSNLKGLINTDSQTCDDE